MSSTHFSILCDIGRCSAEISLYFFSSFRCFHGDTKTKTHILLEIFDVFTMLSYLILPFIRLKSKDLNSCLYRCVRSLQCLPLFSFKQFKALPFFPQFYSTLLWFRHKGKLNELWLMITISVNVSEWGLIRLVRHNIELISCVTWILFDKQTARNIDEIARKSIFCRRSWGLILVIGVLLIK